MSDTSIIRYDHRTPNRHLSIIIQYVRKHSNRLYLNCVHLMQITFTDDACSMHFHSLYELDINFDTLFQRSWSFRVFHPLLGGRRTIGVFIPLPCRRTDAKHFRFKNIWWHFAFEHTRFDFKSKCLWYTAEHALKIELSLFLHESEICR